MTDRDEPSDTPPSAFLGTDVRTRKPVYLPYEDRPRGVSLIGKAGTGKSTVLEHFISDDIENGTPGLVIDPHGLLVERVMQLTPPEHKDRIILVEANQSAPFGRNLLDIRKPADDGDDPVTWASDSVVATIKKLYGQDDDFFPRLEHWLDVAVRTLIPNNGTLAEVVKLFRNDDFRIQCLRNVDNPSIHDEWKAYESLRSNDQITYIEAVVNRLGRMLRPPLLQSIIGSKKTTVPYDEVLYGESMLLVSLPSEKLSQERCDFIASLVLHGFADRVFTRKVSMGVPPRVHVYVDEYQRVASSTTNALIEQGRKYGVGLTIAHQTLQQISDLRIRNASHQSGTLIVLGIPRRDAEELAGEFPVKPTPEWTEEIKAVDGEEPEYVPMAHPVDHLFTTAHVDPRTDRAARILLSKGRLREVQKSSPGSPDFRGQYGPAISYTSREIDPTRRMRSNDMPLHILENYILYPVNPYLHDKLNGFLVRAMHYDFDDPERLADALVENGLLHEGSMRFMTGLESWISTYLEHRDDLKEHVSFPGRHDADLRLHEASPDISVGDLRELLQLLVILCDGLADDPILVPSGQMRPRKVTRLVHHPKQAEQDALNEFAAKLVNPKRKHVAHVKLLSGYHETLLRPPPDEEGVNARTPNPYQPDDIRSRSRALYDASAHQGDAHTHVSPQEPPKRNITRRPRPQDTEPEE